MENTDVNDNIFSEKTGTRNKDEFHQYVRILLERIKRSINFVGPVSAKDESRNRKQREDKTDRN